MSVFVFGHKNPDTDSVMSCITLSNLKRNLGVEAIPKVLGPIGREAQFALEKAGVEAPEMLGDVKIQVKDLNYQKSLSIAPDVSILEAYRLMNENKLRILPVTAENGALRGIITMKDIAMELISGDFYKLNTSLKNIASGLNGTILNGDENLIVDGNILVVALFYKTVADLIDEDHVILVGDRYDVIEHAIETRVKLLVVTGDVDLPDKYIEMAQDNNVPIIALPTDTYTTSRLIQQCNTVSRIMIKENIVKFEDDDYLDEVKDDMVQTNFRSYPVVDNHNRFLGFLSRKHLLHPDKKKVILVDHNEYKQSADGIEEAEILEIVDHHKIGGISTAAPISFMNMTVGSTCTIVHSMYKQYGVEIDKAMATLMMSGIISDTLLFRSPTATPTDKKAVEELNQIVGCDLEEYAMSMFKAGTSLEGYSIEKIVYGDFKDFNLRGLKTGISQVFTLDIDQIFNKKDEFLNFISDLHEEKEYDIVFLAITDILKEGSYILYKAKNEAIITRAFGANVSQGSFVDTIVSRKKQIVPKLTEAIEELA